MLLEACINAKYLSPVNFFVKMSNMIIFLFKYLREHHYLISFQFRMCVAEAQVVILH